MLCQLQRKIRIHNNEVVEYFCPLTVYIYIQARFACLHCAAGGHFVSAGGSLRSPGVTLVNYKGENISKYVCPTAIIYIARKITKFINF